MKKAFVLLAILASPAFAGASDPLPLVQSPGADLTLVRRDEVRTIAEYKGQTHVSGTLVAQWIPGVDEETDNTRQYHLVPFAETAAKLPHFQGYPVQQIELTNGFAALRMVAGSQVADQFAEKRAKVIRIEGTFVLGEYVVGVECDAQWAKAIVVKAEPLNAVQVAGKPTPFGC